MKAVPKLDEKCAQIFAILLVRGELRFKDLKEILHRKFRVKLPEPTLLMHLNHLIKLKLVVKTIKSAKNVTYKPNIEKLEKIREKLDETVKKLKEWKELEEIFLNKPVEEQIATIVLNILAYELNFLKHRILFEKYGRFEDGFACELFRSYLLNYPESLIIKKCLENEDYMKKFLDGLEKQLKEVGYPHEG
ncbi:MAG: hypothetical protein QXJ07_02570 [Candidatus Bathyarchaeia archaeon]